MDGQAGPIGRRAAGSRTGGRIQTMIRSLLTVTVSVSTHARYRVARICILAAWLRGWRLFVVRSVPKRKPGRPVT